MECGGHGKIKRSGGGWPGDRAATQHFRDAGGTGIVGATPKGEVEHLPALPVRGPIDFVGAGDSVRSWLDFDRNAAADSQD